MDPNSAKKPVLGRRQFLKGLAAQGIGAAAFISLGTARETAAEEAETDKHGGFLFIQVTDIHHDARSHSTADIASFIREIHSMKPAPAFVVATGDLPMGVEGLQAPEKVEEQYKNFAEAWKPLKFRKYSVIGNHDCAVDLPVDHKWFHKKAYQAFLGPLNHSFDREGAHFICLDTQVDRPAPAFLNRAKKEKMDGPDFDIIDAAALEWLQKDLSKVDRKTPIVLFTHQPPYEQKGFDVLLAAFKNFNLRAAFCGHWHRNNCLDERTRGGAPNPWVVTGALYGGWSDQPNADGTWRGYRVVSVRGEKVDSCYVCIDKPFMGAIVNVNIKRKQVLSGEAVIQTQVADLKGELKGIRVTLAKGDPVEMKRLENTPYWCDWEAKIDTGKAANGSQAVVLEPYTVEQSLRYSYPVEVKNG
jgi:predicted MPP superfamily phosphohydrolase